MSIVAFRPSGAGAAIELGPVEHGVLVQLTEDLAGLLDDGAGRPRGTDAVLDRLFPDAYPDDPGASAEFRHLTAGDLESGKRADLAVVRAALLSAADHDDELITLDRAESMSWLKSLTDLRLALAVRLGFDTEMPAAPGAETDSGDTDADTDTDTDAEDEEEPDEEGIDPAFRTLYDWLGFLQDTLVEAIDR